MDKKTIRNIIVLTSIAIMSGWLGLVVDKLLHEQPKENTLGMGLWLVIPLIVVILLRTFAGDGWKDAGLKLTFLRNFKYYLISLIIFPSVTAVVLIIGRLLGWIDFSNLNLLVFFPLFINLLVVALLKNIFEESVWRGYLTVKLTKLKLNDLSVYLIVGLAWSAWHLPYYLVFLSESNISLVLPVSRIVFFLVSLATMLVWTITFVELYRLTNSIWPVVLLHAIEDALINPMVIDGYIKIAEKKEIFISPICGIITTILLLLWGLYLRNVRLKTTNAHLGF